MKMVTGVVSIIAGRPGNEKPEWNRVKKGSERYQEQEKKKKKHLLENGETRIYKKIGIEVE